MTNVPDPQSVELEGDYIHVRYQDPDRFETIRTPDWAEQPAESVSEGSEVRTGKTADSEEWEIQSVLIKKQVGEDKAREQANRIYEKIEE